MFNKKKDDKLLSDIEKREKELKKLKEKFVKQYDKKHDGKAKWNQCVLLAQYIVHTGKVTELSDIEKYFRVENKIKELFGGDNAGKIYESIEK